MFSGIGFEFSYSFKASGNLPPGLSMKSNGLLSGTPTAAGTFQFAIDYAFHIGYQGQSYDYTFPLNASLTVTGAPGAGSVTAQPVGLTFSFTQGARTPVTQAVGIDNRSQQARTLTASASTSSGGSWLSVSPGSAAVGPYGAASVSVTANPTGLAPGTYVGHVLTSVAPSSEKFDTLVTATVSSSQSEIVLSQTGLRFQALAGGTAPASQFISVLNGSGGTLNWAATASTVSGGSGWLSISPASGRSDPNSSSSTTVSVSPAGLQPGNYYGLVQFAADGAANSPQSTQIVLTILPATAVANATVLPTGVIFVTSSGAANPAAQTVTLTNPGSRALNFTSTVFFDNGSNWFTVQPATGTVPPGQSVKVNIQPALSALAAGVYSGEVSLRFAEDGSIKRVAVIAVVTPPGTQPSTQQAVAHRDAPAREAGCTPTKLVPVSTMLGSGFTNPAAWPTPIEARVVDDCGGPMLTGSVTASFSSGDAPLSLTSLRDGRWSGTWIPRTTSPQVTVTLTAQQPPIQGSAMIGGTLQANPSVPVISSGGAVSAASFAGQQPLAPGSFTAIFGSHLSQGTNVATGLPWTASLGGTQAFLGGKQLALYLTSDGQVNALVPYDVPPNSTQQLIVQQGTSLSAPEKVTIAVAQPAVFTNDASGKGAGAIAGVHPNGTGFLVNKDAPVTAGDAVVIYCSGLGAVDPPVALGSAAPPDKLSATVNPVSVTMAGKNASVFFAGLAPGLAGLYQVNAIVPDGIAPGTDVPVVITAAGQQSQTVTVAVK